MKKYKVEIVKIDTYIVDVLAKNEKDARQEAGEKWNSIANNGSHHYYQSGDTNTDIGTIYDVTNTDDPFNP